MLRTTRLRRAVIETSRLPIKVCANFVGWEHAIKGNLTVLKFASEIRDEQLNLPGLSVTLDSARLAGNNMGAKWRRAPAPDVANEVPMST